MGLAANSVLKDFLKKKAITMRYLMDVTVSYQQNNIFIVLYVNMIIIKINVLVRRISTCVGHLQVIVKRNELLVVYSIYMTPVGDVVCVLDCVASSQTAFLGVCLFSFVW
jgi:hypothetical protein